MLDGFIKVASSSVNVSVADTEFNTQNIKNQISKADRRSANLLVLPELCVCGYTCHDLFFNETLISHSLSSLIDIKNFTTGKYPIVVLGLPISYNNHIFNCAAVLHNGKILGIVPKVNIPSLADSYESLYFASADSLPDNTTIVIDNETIPFGRKIVFENSCLKSFKFGVCIGQDMFSLKSISENICSNGAVIVANPAAKSTVAAKKDFYATNLCAQSNKTNCGIVFSSPDYSESTQDSVFSGRLMIFENGELLAENKAFDNQDMIISEIDIKKMINYRVQNKDFAASGDYVYVSFKQEPMNTILTRKFEKSPFIPPSSEDAKNYAETVLKIQSFGLKKRLEHTGAKSLVLGVSGGLDSTLALLAAIRTMKLMSKPNSDIIAVTLPCFGTTRRTKTNAERLCELLEVGFSQIDIAHSVQTHLNDIKHPDNLFDATYENAQARERTQVLMDIANQKNGIVLGTGDLSELALGWATYNGDHMSMYSINSSIPKTLVQHIVKYEAENYSSEIKDILLDIVATPISPELLPATDDDQISQKTEDFVGPYELHDFFIYHMLVGGCSPEKLFRMAANAFKNEYDSETIKKWLKTFIRRFFTQQFKRSCMPDGPKATEISLSPRIGLRMPSDASSKLWLDSIEKL